VRNPDRGRGVAGIGFGLIDKANYKAWLVPVDQRTCTEWGGVAR
jgi:hypothetical protein